MTKFDLEAVDTKTLSERGVDMPVRTVSTGEPMVNRHGKPVTLKLLGPDSSVFRTETRAALRERLDRLAEFEKLDNATRTMREAEATDEAAKRILVKMTVGWSGILDAEGKEVEFSLAAATELYDSYPVVREQADSFVNDRARFLMASSAT
jgi:hypothetical protein